MIKKTLKINGVERILILDKDETLAQVLRNHLLLTGCKIGCGEGHCGACNVIMNGKVTRSCIYKMSRVPDNAEITTIEGVGTISQTDHHTGEHEGQGSNICQRQQHIASQERGIISTVILKTA